MKKIFFSLLILVVSVFVVACSSAESSDNMDTIDTINVQTVSPERKVWFSSGVNYFEQSKMTGLLHIAYQFFTIDGEPYVEVFYGHSSYTDQENLNHVTFDISIGDRNAIVGQRLFAEDWYDFVNNENRVSFENIDDGLGYEIEFNKSLIYKLDIDSITEDNGRIIIQIISYDDNGYGSTNSVRSFLYFKHKDGGIVFGDSTIFNDEPSGTFTAYYFYE